MKQAPPTPKAPSQRQLRVGELIRHALADILTRGEVADPDLAGLVITVPEVKLSPDLKLATCYIMPLGGIGADRAVVALKRHVRFIRGEVAHRISLRAMPELKFRIDETFAEADRITALLRQPVVRRDTESPEDE